MKLGKKSIFHIGTEADIRPKKRSRKITASTLNPFSELLPNLYYSPIKPLENIFIFKLLGKSIHSYKSRSKAIVYDFVE